MTVDVAATQAGPTADAPSARDTLTPARAWQAARLPLSLAAVVVVVGAVIAVASGGVRGGLLDPEAARVAGGQALARLLQESGVAVTRVPAPTGASGTTTFVPVPDLLDPEVDPSLLVPRAGRTVVIVGSQDALLDRIRTADPGLDVRAIGDVAVERRQPACALPPAAVAGVARAGGVAYSAPAGVGCYASRGRASLIEVNRAGGRLILVGAPDLFINDFLDEDGNAALALGLLSSRPRVEWVYPRADERAGVEGDPDSLVDLLPDVVVLAAVQLVLAAVWAGLWRSRRLGPVVVEALPVIVRAAESVEGRAGLYRAGRARGRAAESLQAAVRHRLAVALGLGVNPAASVLVDAVTSRTTRDSSAVEALLYGQQIPDDAALLRLARDLDILDGEVRTP